MPKRVSSLRRRLVILAVVGLAFAAAFAAPSVLALWGEPGVTAPGGLLKPPITTGPLPQTRTGALTVSQGTLSGYGRSTFLGAGDQGGVTAVGPPYQGTQLSKSGIRGFPSTVAGGVGTEIGVYGLARTNQGATVGVVGFNGGFPNALAGFFYGPVSVTGNLGVGVDTISSMTIGSSLFVRGLTVPTGPGTITAEATSTTGKSAVASTFVNTAQVGGAAAQGVVFTGTCPAGQRCAGVYGSDGSAAVDIAGIWAGYFNGNVNVQGTVYLNGSPLASVSAKTVSPPQFQNIPSMTLVSSQTSGVGQAGGTNGPTVDSGLGFDGDFLWLGGNHYDILANKYFNYIIKMEPVSMYWVTVCRMAFGDTTTAQRSAFDGQNLWVNSWDGNSGSPPPIATNRLIRIPIGSMVLVDDVSHASNCGGTQVSAATYQPYPQSAPFADGSAIWYSAYQNDSGHYLVEVDPQSLAIRSATPVGDTVAQSSNPILEPKADATYVWVPVVVGGDSRLARVNKSDKSVLVKDYSSVNCPASNPTCLLPGAVSYSEVTTGGGFVWAAALEGADNVNSRQRLLKIDPATGNLLDAFPGGYGGGVLFDGSYVWTSTKTYGGGPAAVLYRFSVSDSSFATKDGVTLGTESTFDRSYIYASSGGFFTSKILR